MIVQPTSILERIKWAVSIAHGSSLFIILQPLLLPFGAASCRFCTMVMILDSSRSLLLVLLPLVHFGNLLKLFVIAFTLLLLSVYFFKSSI
jgi:hypothetical protein